MKIKGMAAIVTGDVSELVALDGVIRMVSK
jgi:hypothetical protein